MELLNKSDRLSIRMKSYTNLLEKEITGYVFNNLFGDITFFKLTNINEKHNGFQFKDGLNIDTNEFNPIGCCRSGGIYFACENKIWKWVKYNDNVGPMYYVRRVMIPNDARVYIEKHKFKT